MYILSTISKSTGTVYYYIDDIFGWDTSKNNKRLKTFSSVNEAEKKFRSLNFDKHNYILNIIPVDGSNVVNDKIVGYIISFTRTRDNTTQYIVEYRGDTYSIASDPCDATVYKRDNAISVYRLIQRTSILGQYTDLQIRIVYIGNQYVWNEYDIILDKLDKGEKLNEAEIAILKKNLLKK